LPASRKLLPSSPPLALQLRHLSCCCFTCARALHACLALFLASSLTALARLDRRRLVARAYNVAPCKACGGGTRKRRQRALCARQRARRAAWPYLSLATLAAGHAALCSLVRLRERTTGVIFWEEGGSPLMVYTAFIVLTDTNHYLFLPLQSPAAPLFHLRTPSPCLPTAAGGCPMVCTGVLCRARGAPGCQFCAFFAPRITACGSFLPRRTRGQAAKLRGLRRAMVSRAGERT